jgi:hypothetical protein
MLDVKKYCFYEFCDCSNVTYEHFISADDCENDTITTFYKNLKIKFDTDEEI